MKFICKKCKATKDIYKVKFTATTKGLVCKDAICCDDYMETIDTEENEGMPTIIRNEKSKDYVDTLMKGNKKREQ